MKKILIVLCMFVFSSLTVHAEEVDYPLHTNHVFTEWRNVSYFLVGEDGVKEFQYPICEYESGWSRICLICGINDEEIRPPAGHKYGKWIIDKPATPYAKGKKHRVCSVCKEEETAVIPIRKSTAAEKKAVKAARKLFAYAKTYNIGKMNACFTKSQDASFFKNNAYMASYCRKYNKKKLRYSVSNIILKGNKATVKLKVTYPDAYKPLLKTCEAMNWNGYSYNSRTGQKKMQSYVKKYTKRFGVRKMTQTLTVSLKKTKKKGWKISGSTRAIKNAINCNYRTALKDAK